MGALRRIVPCPRLQQLPRGPGRSGTQHGCGDPGAPLPGDVAVGFQPAEGLAHGLRLYAHQLGKLRTGHGSVDGEHLHSDDPGMVRPMAPNFSFQECSTRRAAVDNRRPVGQRSISGAAKSIASIDSALPPTLIRLVFRRPGPPVSAPREGAQLVRATPSPVTRRRHSRCGTRKGGRSPPRFRRPQHRRLLLSGRFHPGCTKEAAFPGFPPSLAGRPGGGDFPDPRTSSPSSRPRKAHRPCCQTRTTPSPRPTGPGVRRKLWQDLRICRSAVVIDPDGRVAVAQYNVRATGHVAKLRRDLKIDVDHVFAAAGDACRISGDRGQSEGTDLRRGRRRDWQRHAPLRHGCRSRAHLYGDRSSSRRCSSSLAQS